MIPVPHATLRPPKKESYTFKANGQLRDRRGRTSPRLPKEEMHDEKMHDDEVPAPGPQDESPEEPTHPPGLDEPKVKTEPGLDEIKVKTEAGEGSEEQAGALRNCAKLPAVAGAKHKR